MLGARVAVWTYQAPWFWALLGIVLLWGTLSLSSEHIGLSNLSGVLVSAAILALASLGQTFVLTTGGGAVDLSIPSLITLTAFVTMGAASGADARLPLAAAAAAGLGLAVGVVNALLVLFGRIPPILATLAVGYVLTTLSLLYNRGFRIFAVPPLLTGLVSNHLWGVPLIFALALAVSGGVAFLLNRTPFGFALAGYGQNPLAAELAGIRRVPLVVTTYVLSGWCAAFAGLVLAARVGGAFVGMGDAYLLQTVGAAVLGGTSVMGGRASAFGTVLGAVFLTLATTTMQALKLPTGLQEFVEGAFIVLLVIVANSSAISARRSRNRRQSATAHGEAG